MSMADIIGGLIAIVGIAVQIVIILLASAMVIGMLTL
jgi:hypothetical protein